MSKLLPLLSVLLFASCGVKASAPAQPPGKPGGDVCPPFFLKDEAGNVINPVTGENIDKPYSPRKTCGECHDYDLVVEGFHFQQGRGEPVTKELAERYAWVTGPGQYGGRW